MNSLTPLYQQDLLYTRQESLGTVWLMATLGSKSLHKRKDILNLNIHSICETVADPQSLLQLRYQSNLLYGVALVYKRQIEYCYTDAVQVKTRIFTGFRNLKSGVTGTGGVYQNSGHNGAVFRLGAGTLLQDDANFNIDVGILAPFNGGREFGNVENFAENQDQAKDVDLFALDYFGEQLDDALELDLGETGLEVAGEDALHVLDFDIGFQDFPADIADNRAADINANGNDIEVVDQDHANNNPSELKRKRKPPLSRIIIDETTLLARSTIDSNREEYIQAQIGIIGSKFESKLIHLEHQYYSYNDIAEMSQNYRPNKYSFPVYSVNLVIKDANVEEEDLEDARGRRNSSMLLSIEHLRILSSRSRSRSRSMSMSNSDFFHLQDDFQGLDCDLEPLPILEDSLQMGEEFKLTQFYEVLNDFTSKGTIRFAELIDSNDTKRNVVEIFVNLLDTANSGRCNLTNLENGEILVDLKKFHLHSD